MTRYWQTAGALALTLAIAANAQAAGPAASTPVAAAVDQEEQVDDGLKNFGYLTGLALGCVAGRQRPTLEREAVDLGAEIGRLLGTDRAFIYAAAFGYGTSIDTRVEECKEVLARYEQRVARFRAGRGASK